jgi:hypothetical protein
MKTKSIDVALLILTICITFLTTSSYAAGEYDGVWEGLTPTGEYVDFTVVDDVVTNLSYSATYECPTGSESAWGHGRFANADIINGVFSYQEGVEGGVPADGATFPAIIRSRFDSPTEAVGDIKAGVAAYGGVGLQTQSCHFINTWTAFKVSSESLSLMPEPYDKRFD